MVTRFWSKQRTWYTGETKHQKSGFFVFMGTRSLEERYQQNSFNHLNEVVVASTSRKRIQAIQELTGKEVHPLDGGAEDQTLTVRQIAAGKIPAKKDELPQMPCLAADVRPSVKTKKGRLHFPKPDSLDTVHRNFGVLSQARPGKQDFSPISYTIHSGSATNYPRDPWMEIQSKEERITIGLRPQDVSHYANGGFSDYLQVFLSGEIPGLPESPLSLGGGISLEVLIFNGAVLTIDNISLASLLWDYQRVFDITLKALYNALVGVSLEILQPLQPDLSEKDLHNIPFLTETTRTVLQKYKQVLHARMYPPKADSVSLR